MHALTARTHPRRHGLRSILAAALAACVTPSAPEPGSWDARFELRAYDAGGVAQPLSSLPRRPEFVLSSSGALAHADLLLFSGVPDAALLEDLSGLPLRAAHDARRVAARSRAGPFALGLSPIAPLERAGSYSLALPGSVHLRGGPALAGAGPGFIAELQVADAPGAGAAWLLTSPAAGASGVPPNLAAVSLVLDGEVAGAEAGIWLEDPRGFAVPSALAAHPCAEIDARGASCAVLSLPAPLQPHARYVVRSGADLRDAHGAAVAALEASFDTVDAVDLDPPHFEAVRCLPDELPLALGCALLDDRSLQLRLHAGEPVRVRLRTGQRQSAAISAGGALHVQLGGLGPDELFELEIQAMDLAGNVSETRLTLRAAPELASVAISEVRADPAGPEPAQEYVEIWNFGARTVSLRGMALASAGDERPNAIEHDATLPAGARALLVADGFDPDDPRDPAPPPGTTLIRFGTSLTRSGLANAGERLLLRDAAQHRLSAAPMRTAKGGCLQRQGDDPRSGNPENFRVGPCSPGS